MIKISHYVSKDKNIYLITYLHHYLIIHRQLYHGTRFLDHRFSDFIGEGGRFKRCCESGCFLLQSRL